MISRDTPFLDAPVALHRPGRRRVLQGLAALPGMVFGAATTALASAAPTGVRPRPLVFPADHGSHPDTRIEWWYVTGAVTPVVGDSGGENRSAHLDTCGFQVTFFRS